MSEWDLVLRDIFAAIAFSGIVRHAGFEAPCDELARKAYERAEAMMAERDLLRASESKKDG